MTTAVKQLLKTFDNLSAGERREVTLELLRRSAMEDYGPLSDDALAELADETFLELDAREAEDAQSAAR